MQNPKKFAFVLLLLLGVCAAAVCLYTDVRFTGYLAFLVNRDTHVVLFAALMSLLPIIGFPIIIFLVLAGVKFGLIGGLLLTAMTMALHLSATFLLAHSMLRPFVNKFLGRLKLETIRFSSNQKLFSFILFTAIPGPPYAIKNYILSLSGISFIYYFFISWTIHFVMAVPLIVFGRYSQERNFPVVLLLLVILCGGYFLLVRLQKKGLIPAWTKSSEKSKKRRSRP